MTARTEVPWGATVPEAEWPQGFGSPEPPQAPRDSTGWIGRVIDDRYRIVELLGEGGMGNVYVAEHLKLHKQVAFKTIRPEFAANAQAEARFSREATATAQLDHPHVASAIDFGHLPEGGAYLVIQLVRGVSLARFLDDRGKQPWATVAELGAQIADALAAAHAAGIIHRDLKPDNILIETGDGQLRAKVVDFGIARVADDAPGTTPTSPNQPLTRMGSIIGTPGYMPPEQAVGERVDARGDLYALGVILWEACVGRRLWQGESVTELVACQLASTAPTLTQTLGNQVPPEFSDLVAQLLSGPPSRRPAAAAPVREALRGFIFAATPMVAQPNEGPAGRSAGTIASLSPALQPTTASLGTRLRDHWLALPQRVQYGCIAGAAVLVLLGLVCTGNQSPEAPTQGETPATVATETTPKPTTATTAAPQPKSGAKPSPTAKSTTPTPEPAVKSPDASVPAALQPVLATLLDDDSKSARKKAAKTLLAFKPEADVPAFARNVARLEQAGSCQSKRKIIEEIETADDPRVLPALQRLSNMRRRGCGIFNASDCLGCLRETLARVIGRLQAIETP